MPTSLHNDIELENEICEYPAANGWLYSPNDDGYDRALNPNGGRRGDHVCHIHRDAEDRH
ncbi:MAG: hypothetical protein ACKV2Q_06305 [Planctomycetaceae bacterium]